VVLVALLSGALAGLAGAIEVAGRTGYVTLDMSPGYGYSGIVIAMLAGLHPLGVVAGQRVCGRRPGGGRQHEPRGGRAHLHRRRDRRHLADFGAGGHAAHAIPGAEMQRDAAKMTELFDILDQPAFWVAVLRIATPLILGTLGVLLCERAGVLNLGIEGIMVAGAFTGWLAVFAGPLCGWAWRWLRSPGRGAGPAARVSDGDAGAVAACLRPGHHAAGHQR
jgi:ABC-type uncharacterized transport system permease subunit